MRPARRRLSAAVVAGITLVTPLVSTACGGDDPYPRDEFVKQTTASGIKKPVAECAYDQIKDNTSIMKELNRTGGPNPEMSSKVSDQLAKILARCLLAAEDDGATEAPTTTRKTKS